MSHTKDVWDQKEVQPCSLDVDSDGALICLAGKRLVCLLSSSAPNECVSKVIRAGRWDASCVRCCPTKRSPLRLAIASSQTFELYTVAHGQLALVECVRAHPRNVTDLDWSPRDENIVATCAVDDAVHIWDLRDLKKPSSSLQLVAGANQVKWCKLLDNILATAHDGDVRIWDIRKCGSALKYVPAHLSKVHSLDWHPCEDVCLATASQDGAIKVWHFNDPGTPKANTTLSTAAWKIKFSSSGRSLVSLPLPQTGRGKPVVSVWRADDLTAPAHVLIGHNDSVLDAAWAKQTDDGETLFTVAKDHTLRRWNISNHLLTTVASSPSLPEYGVEVENGSAGDQSFAVGSNLDLKQELDALGTLNLSDVTLEQINKEEGVVTVKATTKGHVAKMMLKCPDDSNDRSVLQVSNETTLSQAGRISLRRQLQEICEDICSGSEKIKMPLLASCLKKLPAIMKQLSSSEPQDPPSVHPSPQIMPASPAHFLPSYPFIYGNLDPRVPFFRTSGAKFSASGILVCFGRVEMRGKDSRRVAATPRSLSALNALPTAKTYYNKQLMPSVKEYYYKADRRESSRSRQDSVRSIDSTNSLGERELEKNFTAFVVLYDISSISPISKELAKGYLIMYPSLDNSPSVLQKICAHNKSVAAAAGRQDLVKVWTLLGQCLHQSLSPSLNPDVGPPWAEHPFGRAMINSLLDHFGRIGDIQTAAMISCILAEKTFPRSMMRRPASSLSSGSADMCTLYNSMHGSGASPDVISAIYHRQRSDSLSEHSGSPPSIYPQMSVSNSAQDPYEELRAEHDSRCLLLDPKLKRRLDGLRQSYADALYSWRLFVQSAQVLKFSKQKPELHIGAEYVPLCRSCSTECKDGAQCSNCRKLAFQCCVCQMAVKGLSVVCPSCGHGGHMSHMEDWFQTHQSCPTGCGCACLNL